MGDSPVRREFGPTLPGLLRARLGLSQRAAVRLTLAVLAAIAAAAALVLLLTGERKLVHEGDPVFSFTAGSVVRQADARPGELMRLDASHGRLSIVLVASRFHLPDLGHGAPYGDMPVYADTYARELAGQLDHFVLRDEGKAGRHDVTGYQFGYRSGPPGSQVTWRDMLLLPDEPGARDGVLLRLRESATGRRRLGPKEVARVNEGRAAMRSFAFGGERP
jgi:hypothetical protein